MRSAAFRDNCLDGPTTSALLVHAQNRLLAEFKFENSCQHQIRISHFKHRPVAADATAFEPRSSFCYYLVIVIVGLVELQLFSLAEYNDRPCTSRIFYDNNNTTVISDKFLTYVNLN